MEDTILFKFEVNSERQIQLIKRDGRYAIVSLGISTDAALIGYYDSIDAAVKDFEALSERLKPRNSKVS